MIKQTLTRFLLLVVLLSASSFQFARANTFSEQWNQIASQQFVAIPDTAWKFRQPAIAGGEATDVDDSGWQVVAPGFEWQGEYSQVWFRTRYVVPAAIGGASTESDALHLEVAMDDDGEIYVNGKLTERFHWDEGEVTLAEHVRPGQVFDIALRGINGIGPGRLLKARLVYGTWGAIQPEFGRYHSSREFQNHRHRSRSWSSWPDFHNGYCRFSLFRQTRTAMIEPPR